MCVFCQIVNRETSCHILFEDEKVMAFLDNDPINDGHMLLIPKEHYLDTDELPTELLTHLIKVSKCLVKATKETFEPDGYTVMQNGGMFNEIGHYHMHIFPRYEEDGFGWTDSHREKSMDYEKIEKRIKEHMKKVS